MKHSKPFALEIPYQDPLTVFSKVSHLPWVAFLDSAKQSDFFGQYSYIAIDPFIKLISKNGDTYLNETVCKRNPFIILKELLGKYKMAKLPGIPSFQGGILGFFSYDLCHYIEKLPHNNDDMHFPDIAVGLYDLVIAFDLNLKKAWIISNGLSNSEAKVNEEYANLRASWLLNILKSEAPQINLTTNTINHEDIVSNFTKESYEQAIRKTIEYIYAGDIFQANISQRFSSPMPREMSCLQLYYRLRKINPAPFAAYINFDSTVLLSASPERFLKLENSKVETRPIKGTRPRGSTPEDDINISQELINSEKDKSENTMIVDLLRNDLSKVCKDHSVDVIKLCGLETYASVHHLVSVITGELKSENNAIDLLTATFPGGSITGAPKVRAMEIITEIEPNKRGPYCGSIGYIGFNGDMDTSITIRTYAIKDNVITFHAGGGIVADSNPTNEYDETLTKANLLIKALTQENLNE